MVQVSSAGAYMPRVFGPTLDSLTCETHKTQSGALGGVICRAHLQSVFGFHLSKSGVSRLRMFVLKVLTAPFPQPPPIPRFYAQVPPIALLLHGRRGFQTVRSSKVAPRGRNLASRRSQTNVRARLNILPPDQAPFVWHLP